MTDYLLAFLSVLLVCGCYWLYFGGTISLKQRWKQLMSWVDEKDEKITDWMLSDTGYNPRKPS